MSRLRKTVTKIYTNMFCTYRKGLSRCIVVISVIKHLKPPSKHESKMIMKQTEPTLITKRLFPFYCSQIDN